MNFSCPVVNIIVETMSPVKRYRFTWKKMQVTGHAEGAILYLQAVGHSNNFYLNNIIITPASCKRHTRTQACNQDFEGGGASDRSNASLVSLLGCLSSKPHKTVLSIATTQGNVLTFVILVKFLETGFSRNVSVQIPI